MNRFVLWTTPYDTATDAATIKPNGRCKVKLRLDNMCNTCTCKTSASTNVLQHNTTLTNYPYTQYNTGFNTTIGHTKMHSRHQQHHKHEKHNQLVYTTQTAIITSKRRGILLSFIKHNIISSNLNMPTNNNTYYGIKIIRIHTANLTHYEMQHHNITWTQCTNWISNIINTQLWCERALNTLNRIMMRTKTHWSSASSTTWH